MTKKKKKRDDSDDRVCAKCGGAHLRGLLLWETTRGVWECISCAPDEVVEASNYGRWRERHNVLTDLLHDIREALPNDTVLQLLNLAQHAQREHAPFSTMLGIAAVQAEQVLNLVALVCNERLPDAVDLAFVDDTSLRYATEPADPDECAECGHSRYAHDDPYSCSPGECTAEGSTLRDGVQIEGEPCECRSWETIERLKLPSDKHDDQPRDHGDE
jgi:hypothetical protein